MWRGGLCSHGIPKCDCTKRFPKRLCIHGIPKSDRIKCAGGRSHTLCKGPGCGTRGNPKYNRHCIRCFVHLFPDEKNDCNYKTKETAVGDHLKEKFPGVDWVGDKRVKDGCSLRRPDLFLDMGSHVVIVEVDENKQDTYDCTCENRRLMELSRDVSHRHLVMIRFNPDGYVCPEKGKIPSP